MLKPGMLFNIFVEAIIFYSVYLDDHKIKKNSIYLH